MEEAALVARAEDERIKIFERYDRGREQGAQIDDWEDPSQIEIYHKTDRHGFIHDTRLPNKRDQTEQKAIGIERIRETKWRKMYANWNSRKTQEVLHRRIYKGIPLSWRPPVCTPIQLYFPIEHKSQAKLYNDCQHIISDMDQTVGCRKDDGRQKRCV